MTRNYIGGGAAMTNLINALDSSWYFQLPDALPIAPQVVEPAENNPEVPNEELLDDEHGRPSSDMQAIPGKLVGKTTQREDKIEDVAASSSGGEPSRSLDSASVDSTSGDPPPNEVYAPIVSVDAKEAEVEDLRRQLEETIAQLNEARREALTASAQVQELESQLDAARNLDTHITSVVIENDPELVEEPTEIEDAGDEEGNELEESTESQSVSSSDSEVESTENEDIDDEIEDQQEVEESQIHSSKDLEAEATEIEGRADIDSQHLEVKEPQILSTIDSEPVLQLEPLTEIEDPAELERQHQQAIFSAAEDDSSKNNAAFEEDAATAAKRIVENAILIARLAALEAEVIEVKRAAQENEGSLAAEAKELQEKLATLEQQVKEKQDMAGDQLTDVMERLNNVVFQCNDARQTLLAHEAKLKEVEESQVAMTIAPHLLHQENGNSAKPTLEIRHRTNYSIQSSQDIATPRSVAGTSDSHFDGIMTLSDFYMKQQRLHERILQLIRPERFADRELLRAALHADLDFVDGRPVAAVLIFRCCLHWKTFETDDIALFSGINKTIREQIELSQEDNGRLSYWLSNTVALINLMETYIKTPEGSTNELELPAFHDLFVFSALNRLRVAQGAVAESSSESKQATGNTPEIESKYHAVVFKAQLNALAQRSFQLLRDNMKKEISPQVGAPVSEHHALHDGDSAMHWRSGSVRSSMDHSAGLDTTWTASWRRVVGMFNSLMSTLRGNHVPRLLVQKLFEQLFSFINVRLFNRLLLHPEHVFFAIGENLNMWLNEVKLWIRKARREWVGDSWQQLSHIRQAAAFLLLPEKSAKSLDIFQELCPLLSVPQLYRFSTMYWDQDHAGKETVSFDVLSEMKRRMVEGVSAPGGHSFLLDDDSAIPFSQEQIEGLVDGQELLGYIPVPQEMRDSPRFEFLQKKVDWSTYGAESEEVEE